MRESKKLFHCQKLAFREYLTARCTCFRKRFSSVFRDCRYTKVFQLRGNVIFYHQLVVSNDRRELRTIGVFWNSNLKVEIQFNRQFHNLIFKCYSVFGLLVHHQGRDLLSTERPVTNITWEQERDFNLFHNVNIT